MMQVIVFFKETLTRSRKGYKNFYKFDGQADRCRELSKTSFQLRPYRPGFLSRSAQVRNGVPQGKKIP